MNHPEFDAVKGGIMEPIKVWRWEDAPEELRSLSPHGGDEDWVALIPPSFEFVTGDTYIGWMQSGGPFGCSDISEHKLPDGSIVKIGAHA